MALWLDNIDHPGMSLAYPENGHVFGDKSVTRRASFSYIANYYYDQRYFVDGSITYNGASSFAKIVDFLLIILLVVVG